MCPATSGRPLHCINQSEQLSHCWRRDVCVCVCVCVCVFKHSCESSPSFHQLTCPSYFVLKVCVSGGTGAQNADDLYLPDHTLQQAKLPANHPYNTAPASVSLSISLSLSLLLSTFLPVSLYLSFSFSPYLSRYLSLSLFVSMDVHFLYTSVCVRICILLLCVFEHSVSVCVHV